MRRKIVILKIKEYDRDLIIEKVSKALDSHFPIDSYFKKKKVLLKPNLLTGLDPSYAITTHPVFIEAVGRIFKDKGFDVCIADNPSVFYTEHSISSVYRDTKVEDIARQNDFKLLYPDNVYTEEDIPFSWWVKEFPLVNMPKLKTHALTVLTGAVKNLYGCISGTYKSYLHKKYPTTDQFIPIILKLYRLIKPALNIVDAVVSLEGEGPARGGKAKKTGFIVIGDDALCVDFCVTSLINLEHDKNPLIKRARELGMIDIDSFDIVSEVGSRDISPFKLPSRFIINKIPSFLLKPLPFLFKLSPKIKKVKCVGCGDCIAVCPKKAIAKDKGNKAVINHSRCILCLCCYEVCRYNAVYLDKSFLLKLISHGR
ncbi:MAG: DUF362 domain-containing protein [Candidatus Omnitrophota bacterium]